ncbi:hypothetical protein H0H93_006816 [Arthromyces matolae]|nr:hypothetical protein H0H93_006816 [Arthromyces matolae]
MKFLRGTHDFPAMLQAPLLKELVLKGSFPDPMIEYIPDLINSSNMGLERFSMNDNKISTSPSLEQFRKLSSALSACKNVDISDPHYPVEELMETTAATDLFPCAEKLWLGSGLFTVPIEFLVSWLESRLEEEATSGVAILREFKICYVEDFDDWPEQIIIEKKFRELEMRYGVVCRVSWVCLQ